MGWKREDSILANQLLMTLVQLINKKDSTDGPEEPAEDEHVQPKTLNVMLQEGLDGIEKIYESKKPYQGLPTGISSNLDEFIGGFRPGQLIALAAAEGMSCPAMVMQIVRHAAVDRKVPTLHLSLGSTEELLAQRLLCHEAVVDWSKLRCGGLCEEEWDRMGKAAAVLCDADLFLYATQARSASDLHRRALSFSEKLGKESKKLGLVVIETLVSRGRTAFRDARTLKMLAKELDAPVLAVWRLEIQHRENMEPVLADLTGRRVLGFPADIVMMLYRFGAYCSEIWARDSAHVHVPKNSNGRVGTSMLRYDYDQSRFLDPLSGSYGDTVHRPETVPPDRMYMPCGDWPSITSRFREVIGNFLGEGFTLKELVKVAGFDDIEQSFTIEVEGRDYRAAWVEGIFLRKVGGRWRWVDLNHLGGISGVHLEKAVDVLFEGAQETRFSWQALAAFLGADHACLASWGNGVIAGRNWLIKALQKPGLLGFKFSFEPGRQNTKPLYDFKPLLDVSKHQEGKLMELSKAPFAGRAGEFVQVYPAKALIRLDLLVRVLAVFGADPENIEDVKLFCRGPRDPVVLVIDNDSRAVIMPELEFSLMPKSK